MQSNIDSITVARLASIVVNALGDPKKQKGKPIEPAVFLPYNLNPEGDMPDISYETAEVFNRLMQQGKLSSKVIAAAGSVGTLNDIKKLLNL